MVFLIRRLLLDFVYYKSKTIIYKEGLFSNSFCSLLNNRGWNGGKGRQNWNV